MSSFRTRSIFEVSVRRCLCGQPPRPGLWRVEGFGSQTPIHSCSARGSLGPGVWISDPYPFLQCQGLLWVQGYGSQTPIHSCSARGCSGSRGVDLRPPSILAVPGAALGPGALTPGRDKGFEVNTDPSSVDCGPTSFSGTGTTVAASQGQL